MLSVASRNKMQHLNELPLEVLLGRFCYSYAELGKLLLFPVFMLS